MPDHSEYTYYNYLSEYFPKEPLSSIYIASNISRVTAFSSRRPTSNGQVKLDIIAPGIYILLAKPRSITKDHNAEVNNTRGNDNTKADYNARSDDIALKPH